MSSTATKQFPQITSPGLNREGNLNADEEAGIVHRCAAKLLAARRAIDATLAMLESLDAASIAREADAAALTGVSESRVLTAMELNGAYQGLPVPPAPFLLSYDAPTSSYLLGSRNLQLTELERSILDMLWQAAPAPISRDQIAGSLDARPGSVDVCVSRIRQKLILMSDGSGHIDSIRGKGWVLRAALCDLPAAEFGANGGTRPRDPVGAQAAGIARSADSRASGAGVTAMSDA